ncbi:HlyC/CorC family transporter [Tabrizicola sp. J26]|uniref:HlyC/CorC family transporter n=1 Tax=Alitabrizicola rongguiensis TaxID=2909234 RepID=UPI001F3D1740|nr:HlyC/CorC family transporter [Tabrizicola rongguiensis]MCF1710124.1 HlyC/CorC family transporter [Tabrizicola rongguiensis]
MDFSSLDTSFWLTCAAIVALLVMSAFFSGSETALTAASRGKLRAQADKGSTGATSALKVTDDNERMIGALLLGNNVVNITSAALATAALTRLFGDSGVAIATFVMTLLVLIFGEVLPKTYAISNAEAVSTRVAPLILIVIRVFSPIVTVVRAAVRGILRLFGVKTDPDGHMLALREEIVGAIALGHSGGAVEKEHRDRLMGALDLTDRTVDEIMRHRSQIEMIDADASPDAILTQCLASRHTRLPVYRESPENILGVVHAKDLLREVDSLLRGPEADPAALADLDILKVAMKPYFIPDTTTLDEQMREFLKRRTHFALVVDEYGALEGLITLEDILEEIVGDIADEFDIAPTTVLKRAADGDYLVEGSMTIRDLNRTMDWSLPDDEANTVAGLVIHEAQMIPNEGQAFSFHGFRFQVAGRQDNRITKLKVRPL